tara:strand:- start:22872 stop:24200 length:1329 start_codon:yes stop_codon:yes gene_type:complete
MSEPTQRYLEIACSNKTSDGVMSYRGGISDLIFQIPAMNSTLIPSSVRIVGKIKVFKNGAKAVVTAGHDISMDSRLGVHSVIQSLTTKSIRHQQNIESIRHYAHFLKSYLPLSLRKEDAIGHMDEVNLNVPNWNLNKQANVVRKDVAFTGNPFCISLPCGLLSGTRDIPLSDDTLSGLEIKLQLAPDSQVLHAVGGTIGDTDCYYELSDLKLVCEVKDYSSSEMNALKNQGVFNYQSISSYYDTINTSNANVMFRLGLSKVRSAFCSFVPSTFLNSLNQNGYATLMPTNKTTGYLASVRKVVWDKGGMLYPKHMELNNNIRDAVSTPLCDPVLTRDYIGAVTPWAKNNSTMINPMNCNRLWVGDSASSKQTKYTEVADGGVVWGLGVSYANSPTSLGEDFSTQQFGMNVELDLTTDHPISAFLFVNSEQSVFFNDNGIKVVQ